MYARIEVAIQPEFVDPGAEGLLRRVQLALPDLKKDIRWGRLMKVYWIKVDCPREILISAVNEIFRDQVLNWLFTGGLIPSAAAASGDISDLMDAAPIRPGVFWGLEKRFRPGVTDNTAKMVIEALEFVLNRKLPDAEAASGELFFLEGPQLSEERLIRIADDVFYNGLIESCSVLNESELKQNARFHSEQIMRQLPKVRIQAESKPKQIELEGVDDNKLLEMSQKNLWALTLSEMKAIRSYFSNPSVKEKRSRKGLSLPTDVEMEVIAQTWSEHCKHKIFNAKVVYSETTRSKYNIPGEIGSLFKETVVGTTAQIERPWLLSVFHDNAGIVAFDHEDAFCIKVETHNSPSALDPYGGALTGIVGVNRDILGCGLGAKPIFNTDVFCLANPDYSKPLPDRILHPRRILDGVRRGVEDGGNKSGIPTVNGALVFDSRFLGKPLIFCGTGGFLPQEVAGVKTHVKSIQPGDQICMVGGRVGKDGIHGATFSSLVFDENSPATAVQLGDPITQKRLSDFLFEARDLGLYRGLTDNGAGGLSSSVGEMAERAGGAKMNLKEIRTKYPGLKPFELVISESQERMTVAVPKDHLRFFLTLAERRGVEVSHIGEFTDSGAFEIFFGEEAVGILDLEFLHNGVPKFQISANWTDPEWYVKSHQTPFEKEGIRKLLELLSRPNIASKEWLIRQYDHEVQGTSVIKPLHTVNPGSRNEWSGPNDSAVVRPKSNSQKGIAVGCGINPKLSDFDPYLMAESAVDEAVRNVLCTGAEYGKTEHVHALVDNFCWPDPLKDPQKAGALVRACYGMQNAALQLSLPFVSGKDSMKNDFRGKIDGRDVQISVPPTLLVTSVARVQDVRQAKSSDFKSGGDVIYLLGGREFGILGSELFSLIQETSSAEPFLIPSHLVADTPVKATSNQPKLGLPNWEVAKSTYGWMGRSKGRRQMMLKSIHDVSDGGLLCAVSECMIARGLGASIEIPTGVDLWEFCFGEGFHSFVVSSGEGDSATLEAEWEQCQVPFLKLGFVTSEGKLDIRWGQSGTDQNRMSCDVQAIRKAWKKEGYWE